MKDEPELTEACIAFWRRLEPCIVYTPLSASNGRKNQRRHSLNFFRLLERHEFVERLPGGFKTRQMRLDFCGGGA